MIGWVGDIESDNLYLQSTKIWYLKLTSIDQTRSLKLYPYRMTSQEFYDEYMSWVNSFPDGALVVYQNGLGFDLWALWKLGQMAPRVGKNGKDWIEDKHVQFVDTYVLSMYLQPDNPMHSLKYLASGSDDEKMEFRAKLIEAGALAKDAPKGEEFKQWHPLMEEYCNDDVLATLGVFKKLWAKAIEMYGKDNWIHPSFRQMQKDYWLYSAQAYTGVKFRKDRAEALLPIIEEQMNILKAEVEPHLPPRPLKTAEQSFYKIPAKPFKKNGEYSTTFVNWLEKHKAVVVDKNIHAYDFQVPIVPNEILPIKLPMEIDDNAELKDYFLANNWKPTFWNYKKDPVTGKPMRDDRRQLIETTPKIQNQGVVCPNLLKLQGDIPSKVVKFLSYRNRLGVVQGWLKNWRLEFDGRIAAEISGYTPTTRVKHKTLTNVPKADPKVLLGYEMRDLFSVDEGFWYIGCDAAALENRTVAQYTLPYDGGKFAELVLEGDSHSFNAFAFFPELHKKFDINDQSLKDNPEFKPYRNLSKTGAYLLAYGGGEAKLASSLNLSKTQGKAAYDNYWTMNEGLGKFKTAAESYFDGKGKKKHLPAIDGRILTVRGKNVLVNVLGQSCGAIAMSYALCLLDTWLGELFLDDMGRPYYLYKGKVVKRVSAVHDEVSLQVEDGIQEEVRQLMEKSIIRAGEILKLRVPLDAEGKMAFGGTWRDVH